MSQTHAVAASSDAAGFQPDEGGSQPTLLLQLPPEDFTARWFDIRPVNATTASHWLDRWHYLHRMPGSATHYGVFAPDLGAVISVGQPNNDHGLAGKYPGLAEWEGNLEISRVARHPSFRVETSRLIALVLRIIERSGIEWVYSYADPRAGHHGGVYQALGAVYLGLSEVKRGVELLSGERVHPRTMVARYGSWSRATVEGMGARFIENAHGGLHTYVLPLGPESYGIREYLAPKARPYPKRNAA